MPYIKEQFREAYDELLDSIVNKIMIDAEIQCGVNGHSADYVKGIHNYVMFMLALKLVTKLGGSRYCILQDIVGTFECCKAEFIRRVVSPYEDGAIEKNGDIRLVNLLGLLNSKGG